MSKFSVGDKVRALPRPEEGETAETAWIEKLGIGTVVNVPSHLSNVKWAISEDVAWIVWQNDTAAYWNFDTEIARA